MTPVRLRAVVLALARQRADLLERVRIDQPLDALADREPAALVMLGDGLRAAQRHRLLRGASRSSSTSAAQSSRFVMSRLAGIAGLQTRS